MATQHFGFIGFEEFRERAKNETLSAAEKIGFPDAVRAGRSADILADALGKLSVLSRPGRRILDIGCGCSDLPVMLLDFCARSDHQVVLVDSQEMLDLLPDHPNGIKVGGAFPGNLPEITAVQGSFDAILVYSVAQVVFVEANLHAFLDSAASLLDHGGQMLIGDLPNASMRRRFLASPAGIKHHHENYDPNSDPKVEFNTLPAGELDDGVLLGLTARYRAAGFNVFLMPQPPTLGMATRREDMLICRP